MSTATTKPSNEAILEQFADDLETIRLEHGDQFAIRYANCLIDAKEGMVAGDGVYYPRRPLNGEEPFAP
jgi:hypothetical protein